MMDAKGTADLITTVRGVLGAIILWLGVTQGEQALSTVIPMMILCWSGDFFDGMLAKRSRNKRKTFIGDHDLQIDVFVSICLGAYLVLSGFVDILVGACYLIGWALVLWRLGMDRNLLMLAQAPVYLYFIVIGLQYYPLPGVMMVVWVVLATMILWKRFSQEVVPNFIHGIKGMWSHRH